MVSLLSEQRLWKFLLILNDRIVSYFQAHVLTGEGGYTLQLTILEYICLDVPGCEHTSALFQVNLFIAAVKALSRKEMQYGSYATAEEVFVHPSDEMNACEKYFVFS